MQLLLDQDNAHLPLPPVGRLQLPEIVSALGEVHPSRRGDAIGEAWLAHSGDRDIAKSIRSWWRRERNVFRGSGGFRDSGSLTESQLAKAKIPSRES